MNKKILTLLTCTALFSMPLQSKAQNLETDLYPVFQIVLENNPDIKMNLASIMSAEGQALQAGLRPNPQAIMELENFGGDDDFSGVDGAELTLGVEQEIEIAGSVHIEKMSQTMLSLLLSKKRFLKFWRHWQARINHMQVMSSLKKD